MYILEWDRNHTEIKTDTDIVLLFIESYSTLWRKLSSQLYCYIIYSGQIYILIPRVQLSIIAMSNQATKLNEINFPNFPNYLIHYILILHK